MATKTNWKAILAVYLIGVAAAAQVGRIAPAANSLREDMAMGLTTYGWMVSLITFASAVLGLAAGYWVVRRGPRFALFAGMAVLFVGLVLATLSPSKTVMLLARVAEGLGYLAIVVAAPTLIAREASGRDTARSLALWGTFFPLGISTAAITGGLLSELFGWRVWFGVNAAVLFPIALLALASVPADPGVQQRSPAAWQSAAAVPIAGFGVAARARLAECHADHAGPAEHAARVPDGEPRALAANRWRHHRCRGDDQHSGQPALWLGREPDWRDLDPDERCCAAAGQCFPGLPSGCGGSRYHRLRRAGDFRYRGAGGIGFRGRTPNGSSPEGIGPANGLIAQIGSVGALTGPPIIGFFIASSGWTALPVMIVIFTLSFLGFAISANAAQRRR